MRRCHSRKPFDDDLQLDILMFAFLVIGPKIFDLSYFGKNRG